MSIQVPIDTECVGIGQMDVVLRTAIIQVFAFIRKHPFLVEYALASLPQDRLTAKAYGVDEVRKAKEWFLGHDIKVLETPRLPDGAPPVPCVTVAPMDDSEASNTLGDVHYVPREEVEDNLRPLTKLFQPVSYTALTGVMVLPSSVTDDLDLAADTMAIVDKDGEAHVIVDVASYNTVKLLPGTTGDFNPCFIKAAIPPLIAGLESMIARETWSVGCHVQGEPVHLTYLYSLTKFALLLGREEFLEARGFGESVISGKTIEPGLFGGEGQIALSRHMIISGNVRNAWPKLSERILSLRTFTAPTTANNPVVMDETDDLVGRDSLSGRIER